MKNNIQIFENEQFGEIRIVDHSGAPWFVANDVAIALGYQYPKDAIRDNCKYPKLLKGEQGSPLTDSPRGINIIPESDLFRLIMRSKLESAERFQDWVVEIVLPAIRKSGSYAFGKKPDSDVYHQAKTCLELEFFVLDQLNCSKMSKLLVVHKVYEDHGIPTKNLPEYIQDGRPTFSAKDLLLKNKCGISTRAFNKLMIFAGFMEVKERTSAKGSGNKKFKSLTQKGLKYGQNDISKHNPRQTQPYYFEDTFMNLFTEINR